MSIPEEKINALKWTLELLKDLNSSTVRPQAPKWIKERVACCLRHFPSIQEIRIKWEEKTTENNE